MYKGSSQIDSIRPNSNSSQIGTMKADLERYIPSLFTLFPPYSRLAHFRYCNCESERYRIVVY